MNNYEISDACSVKLQKSTHLALCSVLEAASCPSESISASDIAKRYGASPHHLSKVLRRLVRAKLLSASRGVGGGYRFAGSAKRTTLRDVIELFEDVGVSPESICNKQDYNPIDILILRVLAEIDETAKAAFSSITLATMLKLIDMERSDSADTLP